MSFFLQVLTEKGVFEQNVKTAVTLVSKENIRQQAVTHAGNEKIRRQGLFESFQVLGSTLMSEELLHKTNRYDILKLVIIK
jgi:hypothetical protein